ncbi:MAG: hypothetical protein AAFZ92_01850 [Pseudomonadota bacterium]
MIDIEDYWELLALHKAIMAAKFGNGSTREMLTSPFLASVAKKVLQAIVDAEREKGSEEKAKNWETWKKAEKNRNEWDKLVEVIEQGERYQTLSDNDIAREIRDILSPLEITDDQISKLIENQIRKAN